MNSAQSLPHSWDAASSTAAQQQLHQLARQGSRVRQVEAVGRAGTPHLQAIRKHGGLAGPDGGVGRVQWVRRRRQQSRCGWGGTSSRCLIAWDSRLRLHSGAPAAILSCVQADSSRLVQRRSPQLQGWGTVRVQGSQLSHCLWLSLCLATSCKLFVCAVVKRNIKTRC